MQIPDKYYEPSPLAPVADHTSVYSDGNINRRFELHQTSQPSDTKANQAPGSASANEPNCLPLHFYLQNLHFQRLNQTINAASKEKRKHKGQQ